MDQRTKSSIILTIILIAVLFINNKIVDTLLVTAISMIGMYEYNKALKNAGYNVIPFVGYLTCLTILLIGLGIPVHIKMLAIKIILPVALIGMFIFTIFSNMKYSFVEISLTILSMLYIPMLFSFVKSITLLENGRILLCYLIAGAFVSDVFAFLIGSRFGKRKLCEKISPKKTVEGAIAGVVGVVIVFIIMTIIFNKFFNTSYNILMIALLGIVASIAGQFGDLAASTIKRKCNIKDFGNVMPGHGGILDRCDSIMFVAPIIYIFFRLFI